MIIMGIVLVLLGHFLVIPVVFTIGWVLLLVGAILWALNVAAGGRYKVGRGHYW